MRASDEAEFLEFVRAASPRLLDAAWYLTGHKELAEDLVQESLERVYARWTRVRSEDAYSYARRTMINLRTDRWRRTGRETVVEHLPERSVPAPDGATVDLVRALARLTERERTVVVLRYYADLSEATVADDLGVSVGTVKTTLHRACAKLRTLLAPEGGVVRA